MAAQEIEYETATGNDYKTHEGTYQAFVAMTKWGTITVIVIVALMAFFLV